MSCQDVCECAALPLLLSELLQMTERDDGKRKRKEAFGIFIQILSVFMTLKQLSQFMLNINAQIILKIAFFPLKDRISLFITMHKSLFLIKILKSVMNLLTDCGDNSPSKEEGGAEVPQTGLQ